MFELEIATSTDFSFSRSSQHIFLAFSPQKNISKNEIPTSYCNNFKTCVL